ncbi:MAG: Trk system potassium transporter TrkA [Phycisphaeraceae bacterium]
MNVIICGAGEVGTYAAEVLGTAGHDITIVDSRPERLADLEDRLDVRTLAGNCANADVLREAGAADPQGALVAATSSDEINLLTAAVAKGIGVGKCIARVHHSAYFNMRGLDYARHLGIDRLICPEWSTAQAIASTIRNPAALAIENFAAGRIEMQEFPVDVDAPAVGKQLVELNLPKGVRLAAVRRGASAFVPVATTIIDAGDVVILVGNSDVFPEGRKLFQRAAPGRRRLVIMGGTPEGVWLCRALRDRAWSIRLFEQNRERAEELANKLDWVTVVHSDPTELNEFEEERIADVDAFVGLTDDDEHNILGCAWAKSTGVKRVIAMVQRPRYAHLVQRIGIDHVFSPRVVAAKQIERSLDESPMLRMATLAEGVVDLYRVRVAADAPAVGQPLRKLPLGPEWMLAAIQHDIDVRVPTADDLIDIDDTVLVVGRHGTEDKLHNIFGSA